MLKPKADRQILAHRPVVSDVELVQVRDEILLEILAVDRVGDDSRAGADILIAQPFAPEVAVQIFVPDTGPDLVGTEVQPGIGHNARAPVIIGAVAVGLALGTGGLAIGEPDCPV